ncbi:MAG: MscL family protein [Gemmatimonadaceae bacterium]|nr:MscL family protein [Gemmatimonadaceae bacterium]
MGEFKAFLKEYGVIGLALGVIIGGKAGELVTSIVDGLLMPIIGYALKPLGTSWQTAQIGPFMIGQVIGALINFIIVAYFVFWASKKLLKEDSVTKK